MKIEWGDYMFIKEFREKSGFSQLDVSKYLNVTQSAISQYETGVRKPSIEILINLSELFNCTVDELLKGE